MAKRRSARAPILTMQDTPSIDIAQFPGLFSQNQFNQPLDNLAWAFLNKINEQLPSLNTNFDYGSITRDQGYSDLVEQLLNPIREEQDRDLQNLRGNLAARNQLGGSLEGLTMAEFGRNAQNQRNQQRLNAFDTIRQGRMDNLSGLGTLQGLLGNTFNQKLGSVPLQMEARSGEIGRYFNTFNQNNQARQFNAQLDAQEEAMRQQKQSTRKRSVIPGILGGLALGASFLPGIGGILGKGASFLGQSLGGGKQSSSSPYPFMQTYMGGR